MKLTIEDVQEASSSGSCFAFNAHQFRVLGLGFPQPHGWPRRLVGKEVQDHQWKCVLALKGVRDRRARASILRDFGVNSKDLFTSKVGVIRVPEPPKPNAIEYPSKASEFEVQAELYWCLKDLHGVNVRGNVPAIAIDGYATPKCFFDLVAFTDDNAPVAIIECKNRKDNSPDLPLRGRQFRRYSSFGIPLLLCDRMREVAATAEKVLNLLAAHSLYTLPKPDPFELNPR